jgi:hypothetical protein
VPVTTMGSLAMNSDVNSRHGTDSPQPQNADPLQASQAWRPIVWSSRSRRIESGASPRSSLAKRSNVEVLPYATYSCALFPPSLLRQGGFGAHSGQSGIYVANRKESVPDWSSGLLCIQNGTERRTKKERRGTFDGRRKRRTNQYIAGRNHGNTSPFIIRYRLVNVPVRCTGRK